MPVLFNFAGLVFIIFGLFIVNLLLDNRFHRRPPPPGMSYGNRVSDIEMGEWQDHLNAP